MHDLVDDLKGTNEVNENFISYNPIIIYHYEGEGLELDRREQG